jgi:hypothetical protein
MSNPTKPQREGHWRHAQIAFRIALAADTHIASRLLLTAVGRCECAAGNREPLPRLHEAGCPFRVMLQARDEILRLETMLANKG